MQMRAQAVLKPLSVGAFKDTWMLEIWVSAAEQQDSNTKI